MHKHDILYLHCKKCTSKDTEYKGLSVSISDQGMLVVCESCGGIVFSVKKGNFDNLIEYLMKQGCSQCNLEIN